VAGPDQKNIFRAVAENIDLFIGSWFKDVNLQKFVPCPCAACFDSSHGTLFSLDECESAAAKGEVNFEFFNF